MSFYITNYPQFLENPEDFFKTDLIEQGSSAHNGILIHIDGYIIPRLEIFEQTKNENQHDLLFKLYIKYGTQFIRFVKGVFNIVIIDKNKFFIYNDPHSIKKVFIYSEQEFFFISNDMKKIRSRFALTLNRENAAIFCLLNHFLIGQTLFTKTTCSEPATIIEYSNRQLSSSSYWKPDELLSQSIVSNKNESDFTHFWEKLISSYIEYLTPQNISITLTGGNDSRLVLAPLLKRKISFSAFTYGNPDSADVVIAKQIVQTSNINFRNYFVDNPSKEWFLHQSEELIDIGNSLVNIHRAHRNDALEKETVINPKVEMVFTGLMGGEYLKEPSYDNIVLPKVFQELLHKIHRNEGIILVRNQLSLSGIDTNSIDLGKVYDELKSFLDKNFHKNNRRMKFLLTYYHYGCGHHTQDSFIFNYHCKHVVNPFMDIDFLEKISSSDFWYLNKRRNLFGKIFHSRLYIEMTDKLAPELSDVPYAKRGQYTANEMINKPLFYLLKRFKYIVFRTGNQYPSSFPMDTWLYDFSKEQLDFLHPDIKKLFFNDILLARLEIIKSRTKEEQWHPVTNPINLSMCLKSYENT
jgi:hypothetical protein